MEKKDSKRFKGIIPIAKSILYGDAVLDPSTYRGDVFTTQTLWQSFIGSYTFNTEGLDFLIKTGYGQNPECYGAINKILLSQANIKYIPWRNGKIYKSGTFNLDIKKALFQLIATGSCIIWKRKIVGFEEKSYEILKTNKIIETYSSLNSKFIYQYYYRGRYITIPEEDLIIITLLENPWCDETQLGIGALQAAQFPIENLQQLWKYNASVLANKGADVLISSKTDMPLLSDEKKALDDDFLRRSGGIRNAGKAITTTGNVQVDQIGRTPKELSLWDGFKVTVRSLAIALQIDPSILGDVESKTFANRNEAEKALYTSCIIPYVGVILNDPRLVQEFGFSVYLDTSNIECLQEDKKLRAETATTETNAILLLNADVKSGNITKDIAVHILVTLWNFDQEEAELMIQDVEPIEEQQTTDNQNLDIPL